MGKLDEALLGRSLGAAPTPGPIQLEGVVPDNQGLTVTACAVDPERVTALDEVIAYAGCIENTRSESVEAGIMFLLDPGPGTDLNPIVAQTDFVTIDAGETFCPPAVERALNNPVADRDDVIQSVVADGGRFDITSRDVVRA